MAIQRLRALTQGHDTVAVYTGKVHQLLYLAPNMDMESRIQHYTAGLSEEVRQQVIFHGPTKLVEAVKIAERAELAFVASPRTRTQQTTQQTTQQRQPQRQLTNVETGAASAAGAAPAAQTSETAPAPPNALAATTRTRPPVVNPEGVVNWRSTAKCCHCTENGHVAVDCPEKKAGKPARCYMCHSAGGVDGEGEVERKRCSIFIGYGGNDGICGYGIRESGAAGGDGIGCNYSSGRRRESWIGRHHRHRAVRAADERWWGDEV
jgi:hypothetical protein